ncbi:hypothetical protein LMG19087_02965 [Ralstonia wenshanensis]|uniref:type II toxin-antitoxin system MqsA family antitoxin n=1 Tax=Ralstonia wenshanensis TaxID=2842456 RepID=UPI0028F5B569|nr:type II toxin-antitoxin system MqsA family antitoxin [Ralstonia wenshanensis]CAJ0817047.1 hypothetical protein LMG19087_02965 [Ralstonia wenshanensis]
MSDVVCEVCGMGTARHITTDEPLEYRGHTKLFALHGHICDVCGTDYATAEDMRLNKRIKIAFEKTVDGLLASGEVKAIREGLDLTQAQAALLFGGGPVAFSKYENDEVAQSASMDRLLRVVSVFPQALEVLARQCSDEGVQAKILGRTARSAMPSRRSIGGVGGWHAPITSPDWPHPTASSALRIFDAQLAASIAHHIGAGTLAGVYFGSAGGSPKPSTAQTEKPKRFSVVVHGRRVTTYETEEQLGGDEPEWEEVGGKVGTRWTSEVTVVEGSRRTH